MMYTMPKNLLSICVNFALATQRFLWIGYIVDDVTDCPTFCAPLANMKRHDSCGCHRGNLLSKKETACMVQTAFVIL